MSDRKIDIWSILDFIDKQGKHKDILEWTIWSMVVKELPKREGTKEKILDIVEQEINKWIKD